MEATNNTAEITQGPLLVYDVAIKRAGYGDNVEVCKMLMIRKNNNNTPAFYIA